MSKVIAKAKRYEIRSDDSRQWSKMKVLEPAAAGEGLSLTPTRLLSYFQHLSDLITVL